MPSPVTEPNMFNESYPTLGRLRTDRHMIPHLNSHPTDSLLPGEPFLKEWGGRKWVCVAQSRIKPGEVKAVLLNWNFDFRCELSADVKDGDQVYWDPEAHDDGKGAVVLQGDAGADAFPLGIATYSTDPGEEITAAANDRNVVATAASTMIQVVSFGEPVEVGS